MANNLGAIICRTKVMGFGAMPNKLPNQPKRAAGLNLFTQL
jgi:hypothetical protein